MHACAKNDMSQPLPAFVAHYLAGAGVACVLRFDFPYAHRGATSPDPQPVLQDAYRRAHHALLDDPVCAPGPIFLGGKSLGARVAPERRAQPVHSGHARPVLRSGRPPSARP